MRFTTGNHISLLRSGTEYFPALTQAINHAKHSVYLQTYIYEMDSTGMAIGNVLKHAAMRGVSVNVLLDGFGCKDLSKKYIEELEQAGVKVMFYRPKISPWTFKKNRLRRMHRKVAVIDGTTAFVGGINIIDDENTPQQTPPRIDYAVKIQGALTSVIEKNVFQLWRRIAITHLWRVAASTGKHRAAHHSVSGAGVKAAFVIRDNVLHRRDIEDAYLHAIDNARAEIIIANAYFVPGRRFRKALTKAAMRGVKVKLLLQGRIEYFMMFATRAFYWRFLNSGIEIYEYHKSFMHSKVAVIDNHWATVGSSNIDPFSLLLAHEANVLIQDTAFANALRSDIEAYITNGAQQVTALSWAKTNVFQRITSWVAYGIVRLFLGVIGSSKEQ